LRVGLATQLIRDHFRVLRGNGLGAEILFSRQRSLHVGGEHAIVLRLRLRNSSAQPFASISLAKAQLSGGQKTMVALCLIFLGAALA